MRPKSEPGDARLSRTPFAQLPGLAIAGTGIALLGLVVFANSAWFDRHFLPDFFMPRSRQLAIVTALRLMAVLFGLILVLIGRTCVRRGGEKRQLRRLASKTAIVAGVCVSSILTTELILRTRTWHAAQFHNSQEPRRIADPYLGWVFQPNHHGRKLVAGRRIDFAIDALGYRVGGPSQKVDYTLPAVIFSGESVMAGDGLQWRDAIPAQVGDRLHIQPVDIAVNGYSPINPICGLPPNCPASLARLPWFRFSCQASWNGTSTSIAPISTGNFAGIRRDLAGGLPD